MMTYLVVDDSPTVRATLSASISTARPASKVVSAEDAKTAFELVKSEQPGVVFLDMMLTEEGGGLDVANKIAALSPDTRIIIVTGLQGDHPDVTSAINMGAFAYVQKPIRRQSVSAVLDDIDEEDQRLHRIR